MVCGAPETWQNPREQRNPLDSQPQETPVTSARQAGGERRNPANHTLPKGPAQKKTVPWDGALG